MKMIVIHSAHLIDPPVNNRCNNLCLIVSSTGRTQDSPASLMNIIDKFRIQWYHITRVKALIPTLPGHTDS
jgi:hypothetical protein